MSTLPRRLMIHKLCHVTLIALAAPLVANRSRAADACGDPTSQPLRPSLNYAKTAPKASQTCSACGYYTPTTSSSCGTCVIMSGPVDATGHCDSWSPKDK